MANVSIIVLSFTYTHIAGVHWCVCHRRSAETDLTWILWMEMMTMVALGLPLTTGVMVCFVDMRD